MKVATGFASTTKPKDGASGEQRIPALLSGDGQKIGILLEEIGIEYDAWIHYVGKGMLFYNGFVEITPNSMLFCGVGHKPLDGGKPVWISCSLRTITSARTLGARLRGLYQDVEQERFSRASCRRPTFSLLSPTNQRCGFATRAEADLYADVFKLEKTAARSKAIKNYENGVIAMGGCVELGRVSLTVWWP